MHTHTHFEYKCKQMQKSKESNLQESIKIDLKKLNAIRTYFLDNLQDITF